MAMTKAKRARLAKRGNNPADVLGLAGRIQTGAIRTPRDIRVTARVSIDRVFVAPRSDMGESNTPHY